MSKEHEECRHCSHCKKCRANCFKKHQTPEDFPKAVFEMFEILDEKVTKINNKFDKMAKELGYEN